MKKKPSTYTRAGRSNVTLKNFLNNLKDNDLHFENNQITQCVFLGVLRLKPVPSMFCTSTAVSTDSVLEVKNRNKRNRRVENNNNNKELNKNSSHKTDINKVISGRIRKKDSLKVKQSVKKVPITQSILKVNFKMNKNQETPSTSSCLSNNIILSDTGIIPQCPSSRSPNDDKSILNPVQNLFNKLKQQIDERNHQQESSTDQLPARKLKYKANKRKTLQDRLPMPLQSGSSNIEVDSDSSGFKDDGIVCSSSDTNSISPVSQNSLDDKNSNKAVILIEDDDPQKNDDVVILNQPNRKSLSTDTSQNNDVILIDTPTVSRMSPRTKRVNETKQLEGSSNIRELTVSVPKNEDNTDNDPSTSLLQTYMPTHDYDKPKKRRKFMPPAMPSIFFNTPMLLRSELAQKKSMPMDNKPVSKSSPRLIRPEIKQEKSPKQRGDGSVEKIEETENSDDLIYEVVKSSETISSVDKEIIVIDDVPPKVEPLILKLKMSPQKASPSRTVIQTTSGNAFEEAVLSLEKNELQVEEMKSTSEDALSPKKQVSIEKSKSALENSIDSSKFEEYQLHCIIIEDDEKSSETENKSSNEVIVITDEDNVKSINSEVATEPNISVVKESILKGPQNNNLIVQNLPVQSNECLESVSTDLPNKTELIKESLMNNLEDRDVVPEKIISIDSEQSPLRKRKNSAKFQKTKDLQIPVIDVIEIDSESVKETSQIQSNHEDTRGKKNDGLQDITENEESISADNEVSSTDDNIPGKIIRNKAKKDYTTSKTSVHEIAIPLLATSRVLRSEKSQQKSTEQMSSVEQAVTDATVPSIKMEKPQNTISNQQAVQKKKSNINVITKQEAVATHKNISEAISNEEYINPPEATSRVLRSEKIQLDKKNKSETVDGNKELNDTFIMFPGATARVLRSEKNQQKAIFEQPIINSEIKSKVSVGNVKIASSKIKPVEKVQKNQSGKRSLRSSIVLARSESPTSSLTLIHDQPKQGKKNRSSNANSQNLEQVLKKGIKKMKELEINKKERSNIQLQNKASFNATKKSSPKNREKGKKIITRVLRSSEIKHQPELAESKVKSNPKSNSQISSGIKKSKDTKKRNATALSKLNKLRKIVSIKTKKIAREKNIVNWKNNEIIEEIIQELKSTIFKNDPEDDELQSAGGSNSNASAVKKKTKAPKRQINLRNNQQNKLKGNKSRTRLQKHNFNAKKKKQVVKRGNKSEKDIKKTKGVNLAKKKQQCVAEVTEDMCATSNIPTRRTGRRNIKLEIVEEVGEDAVNEAPTQKYKELKVGRRRSTRNVNAKENTPTLAMEAPKKVGTRKYKKQQLENTVVHDEHIPLAELDGTPKIIEVDCSLNEKKDGKVVDIVNDNPEVIDNETAKRKTPPASIDKHGKKTKVPKQVLEEEPTVIPPAALSPPDPVPNTQAPKKISIIIHDDIVLPDETVKRPVKRPDLDYSDKKGDITVFDFDESESELSPTLRPKASVTTKEKMWSRINVDKPRRKKKLWTEVEQPVTKKSRAENDFARVVALPSGVKREASGHAVEGTRQVLKPSEVSSGDIELLSGTADTAVSPIKSESPMKQLTITEMFSKFSKKKVPSPRPALVDCQPEKTTQWVSSTSPSKALSSSTCDLAHPGPSDTSQDEKQTNFISPSAKTEMRRYSRIDNVEDDDSDCESRAEWVPEEYAEYKFKYSAQKMMQVKPIYKCKVCLALLPSYYKLVKHKKCHENVENPYNCSQCGALFNNVDDFSAHLRAHKGKHPYECLKCSMGFWTKQAYEDHAPIHILRKQKPSVKRFRCDVCAKEFSKLCDVERHTRVHTGEKPCVCNICNKGFQQSHNLSKHLLTHLHIKPFQCEICNRQFGRNDVLNRHLLTHSIEKPIKCWVCSKGFIRHTQLMVHLMNHHPDQPMEDPNRSDRKSKGEEERKTDDEVEADD